MEFPEEVPEKLKVDLYSLILGVINNGCPVPCKTVFVHSSLG